MKRLNVVVKSKFGVGLLVILIDILFFILTVSLASFGFFILFSVTTLLFVIGILLSSIGLLDIQDYETNRRKDYPKIYFEELDIE